MAPDVPFGESRVVEELLSIVLVTSPVPSNPSTQMLEHVLSSCTEGGGLEACQKIIVSDGFRICETSQRPKPKAGRVAEEWAAPYEEFRSRVDGLQVKHLRCAEHKGFAGCLHIALRQVATAFVLVLQHDRPCLRPFDASGILEVLAKGRAKYVGLPSKASLARTEASHLASNWHVRSCEAVIGSDKEWVLRPLFMWYDSAHICRVDHYKDLVFRKGRDWSGGFIEDSFGQEMQTALRAAVATGSWREVHEAYGTYLYDDGAGPVIGHLNGRRYSLDSSRKLIPVKAQEEEEVPVTVT
ncbi:unnamed protein product [Effrenium voratum]|nr:unnamed protein product [Effrenium voratum]